MTGDFIADTPPGRAGIDGNAGVLGTAGMTGDAGTAGITGGGDVAGAGVAGVGMTGAGITAGGVGIGNGAGVWVGADFGGVTGTGTIGGGGVTGLIGNVRGGSAVLSGDLSIGGSSELPTFGREVLPRGGSLVFAVRSGKSRGVRTAAVPALTRGAG